MNHLYTRGVELATDRDRLFDDNTVEGKLIRLWDWLEANPDHPEHERRHGVWISALRKYEKTCDRLNAVERRIREA